MGARGRVTPSKPDTNTHTNARTLTSKCTNQTRGVNSTAHMKWFPPPATPVPPPLGPQLPRYTRRKQLIGGFPNKIPKLINEIKINYKNAR